MKYFTKQWYEEKLTQQKLQTVDHVGFTRQVAINYQKHYEQIRELLTDRIKDITDLNIIHDCIINKTQFNGENFKIEFNYNGINYQRDDFRSMDFSSIKSDYFFLSGFTFINAKVHKNELSMDDWCLHTEIYIHPDGYEIHLLAVKPTNYYASEELSELIITFKDVTIEVTEV